MAPMIRPSRPGEEAALQDIERRAGERFREIGLADVADDDPPPAQALARYITDRRSWVAVDHAGTPVGYVLADEVDGCAHVAQVSVLPEAQGTGVGRALLARVEQWADQNGLTALTLTTFRDVPWNAPLYRHLGFSDLAEEDVGPGLMRIRDEEAAQGLDPAGRVCMRRELPPVEDPDRRSTGSERRP
jgi:GNAT superfamily N-acetyltransferase